MYLFSFPQSGQLRHFIILSLPYPRPIPHPVMLHGHTQHQKSSGSRANLLIATILCFYTFLPGTKAQSSIDLTASPPPSAVLSTMSTQTSFSTITSIPSTTISSTSSISSNSTTSSSTQTATDFVPPELFPPATHADSENERRETVFNYYFLFLVVFGLLVTGGLWWLHRRRKRQKEQMRLSGQHALAQDLEGWINTRRWMHGAWRHNQTNAFIRREEGLNEHGEAPPPYQPKSETVVSHEPSEAARDTTSGLTIPLRTLSREEIGGSRPPEYNATAQPPSNALQRSNSADLDDIQAPVRQDISNATNPHP